MSRMAFMATLVLLVTSFTSQAQSSWYVNDATAENGWSAGSNALSGNSIGSPKATIQAAINAAAPGDIIYVGTGTFNTPFSVTKSLTIRGINYQQSGPTRGPTAADESIITGARAVISINANNVTIEGFRIVPTSSRIMENPNGTGLTLTNNVVIVNGSRNPTYGIFDARMYNISGLNISGNLFQCTSGTGGFIPVYLVRSTGSLVVDNATISNNAFVNTAHGIYMDRMGVGSMANVSITNNTFDNIQGVSTGTTGGGRAISANGLSNSSISGNTFNNVYYFGLQLGASNTVSVSNNNFTGSSINGVRVITSMNNVVVNNNNFSGNFSQKAIVNAVGSGVLDATCNWLGANSATATADAVTASGAGSVSYSPWLINNVDDDANAAGFQPQANTCIGGASTLAIDYITADEIYCESTGSAEIAFTGGVAPFTITWPGGSETNASSPFVIPSLPPGTHNIVITDANSSSVNSNVTLVAKKVYNASWGIAYSSLQAAIDAASPGDVITLCSGTYNEKISIGKTLTILGPNANISPNTDGNPSLVNATRYDEAIIKPNETNGALLTATASGISVVMKGIVFDRGNGTEPYASFVHQSGRTGNSWVLENNIFRNAPETENGYFLFEGAVTGMSFNFNNNRLQNNGVSNGISLWGFSPINVAINNNVWYNNSGWSLNVNSIQGTINNNYFVDGRPAAFDSVWYTVQNGFVIANDNNNLTVTGNVFNNLHSGINIYRGDDGANNQFGGTMAISNNSFQQLKNYAIRGGNTPYMPNLTNVTIHNNSFINAKLLNVDNTFAMNATCNWFGSLNAQTIASGISGNVTYSPWLVNGTDEQPATMGFQPGTGLCTGTAPTISSLTQTAAAVCLNNIGAISATFANGTAPYSITLNAETPVANVTSPYAFNNLAPGTYTVTITDVNGSTVSSTVVVNLLPVVVKNETTSTLTGYSTIQDAINASSNGDSVYVCAGTYNENVTINKSISLFGISRDSLTGTIIAPNSGNGIEIAVSNVNVKNLYVKRTGRLSGVRGINLGSVSDVKLENVAVSGCSYGVEVNTSAVYNLTMENVAAFDNSVGFRVATGGSVEGMTVNHSNFDGNDYGFYTTVPSSGTSVDNQNKFQNITIYHSTFNKNAFKGIYVEKLHNATLRNIVVDSSAYGVSNPNGIDLNLKRGFYGNIVFDSIYVKNSGNGAINGNGIAIKGRNDAPSYSTYPGTLTNLTLNNVLVNGSPIDLAIGNGVSGVVMDSVVLEGNGYGMIVYGIPNANPASFNLGNTNFSSSLSGYLANSSNTAVLTATDAIFGGVNAGATLTNENAYLIADKVYDNVDTAIYGRVILKNNQVYVTTNSYIAPSTVPSINRGILAASVGDTVNVASGNYLSNVVVDKSVFLHGNNAGIAGNSLSRNAETVIKDAKLSVSGTGAVVVDGFDFYQTTANHSGTVSLTTGITPVTIQNNIIERWATVTESTVRGIETSVTTAPISITNNLFRGDISGGLYGGHKTWNSGIFSNGGNVSITNNEFVSCRTAINMDDMTNNVVMNNNTFGTNETAISFGGTTPTQGSYTISGNNFNTPLAVINLSNVNSNFRLDATSNNFNGVAGSALTLAQAFVLESQMYHKGRGGNKHGLVRVQAGKLFDTTTTTINNNILYADAGDVIHLSTNTFNEDVVVNKNVTLKGAGIDQTIISGPKGGNVQTIKVETSAAIIENMTITREGNNLTDWNDGTLNSAGVAIQSQGNAAEVRYCKITGNRTGIDINNSNGNNIHDNIIDNNRTGMFFRNQTDNTTVTNNDITNNWTVGIVFLDASSGSNSPVQSAANSTFSNNNISGNWYAQIEDRQSGGSLPAPGSNMKNFECNWFGLNAVKKAAVTAGEPSYASQIPVAFGGTAVAPAQTVGQICGVALDNVDFEPWLVNGVDDNANTAGFQPANPSCIGVTLSLTVNALDTVIYCKDETNAYLDLTINGGVAPYTINLDGSTEVTNDLTFVTDTIGTPGLHSLVITDAIGSSTSLSFTVIEPAQVLALTATPVHPKCASDDGSIVLNATGGTSPIAVDIDGNVYQATETATAIDPGNTYTVIATDANGCTVETEVSIDAAPDALEFDASTASTNALCAGLNGELVFLANGGTGTISYTVNNVADWSPKYTTAGTYTIVATDENSCTLSTTLTINQPLGISIVVSNLDNAKCFGEAGSFNLRGVGGTATDSTGFTYEVDGDPYYFSGAFYGNSGVYTVVVTDAINTICSVSTVVTITEPDLLEVNVSTTDVACFGGNGTLSYTVTGGTSTYSIDINSDVFSDASKVLSKPADTYTVSVTDANYCTAETVVEITQPAEALTFNSASSTSPDCFGQTGSIIFEAQGGTGSIEYRIDNNLVTSPHSVTAGTYTVTASDENGCTATTAILLQAPTKVTFDFVTLTHLTCFENASGAINFDASGGTGGINFTLNGDPDVSPVLSKAAGTYTITAFDENACSVDTVVTLTEPNIIEITSTVTDALCKGANGSVAISAIGGTGSKTFTVNTNANNGSFTGTAGVYTVVATDASSCTISKTFTINEPATAVAFNSSSATPALCFGGNGTLTFGATGGTGTITYLVNGNSQGSPFNTIAGTYTITATDDNGCSVTTTLVITEPAAAVTLTASKSDALCNGVEGSLTFSGNGGTGAFTYTVNGNAQTSPFNALAGTYTVIGTDANGCSSSETLTIGEPSALTFTTASKLDASCNSSNGSLTFVAGGGTGTISYTVNNVAATSPYTAAAGAYTVIATDANSCSVSVTFSVAEPSPVVLTATKTNALCKDGQGSLTFSATGGAGTYTYTVNNNSAVSPLSPIAGMYTIVASDANNCSTSTILEITEPALLELSATASNAPCNGANGSITFSATGGTSPYTFKNGNTTIESPLATLAGSYTVTVIDANGCSTSNTTLTIEQPSALSFGTATVTNALCYGGNGQLTYSVSGGTGTKTYTVNNAASTSPSTLVAGTYTVNATDANNCSISTIMTVTQPDLIVLTASKTDAPCKSENGSLTFSAIGGTGTLTYTVNNNAQVSPYNVAAGTYTVAVTDINNCSKDTVISVSEPDLLTINSNVSNAACFGSNGSITFSANGGTANYEFKVNGTTATSPYTAAAGTYTIAVTDSKNCSTTSEVTVTQPNLITTSQTASACYSYTWPVSNTTYTVTGNYTHTLTANAGCDSVVTLNLTITPYSFDTTTVVSYLTYTWPVNNQTYTVSNQYVDTSSVNGSPSCTVRVLKLTITTCKEPINLTATPAQQAAAISWAMPTGTSAPNYAVQVAPAGTNNWSAEQTTSNLSFNFTGLTSNTAYDYRVRALCGTNSVSEWVAGSFTTNVITCATPTFNTSTAGLTTATVSWSNTGAGSYILSWKAQGTSTWSTATVSGTQTRNLTGLTAGTTYDVKVYGFCLNEVYSDTAFTTFTTTAPCGNISYTSNTPARTTIRLDWTAVPGAISYTSQRRGPNDASFTSAATNTNLNRTFTVLTANTTYTLRVRANCPNSNSGAFNEVVITTTAAKSAEEMQTAYIVNFYGEMNAEGNNLMWSTATENNCQEMVLEHSTNGSDYSDIARIRSLADGGTSEEELNYGYLHKDAPFGVNYYRLKSINLDGTRAYHKDIVTLTKEVPAANVRVYPNPTKDLLNLDFNAAQQGQVRVKILDMTGRVVKVVQVQVNQGENSVGVGIGEFPQGIYTIQMIQDNQLLHVSKIYRKD